MVLLSILFSFSPCISWHFPGHVSPHLCWDVPGVQTAAHLWAVHHYPTAEHAQQGAGFHEPRCSWPAQESQGNWPVCLLISVFKNLLERYVHTCPSLEVWLNEAKVPSQQFLWAGNFGDRVSEQFLSREVEFADEELFNWMVAIIRVMECGAVMCHLGIIGNKIYIAFPQNDHTVGFLKGKWQDWSLQTDRMIRLNSFICSSIHSLYEPALKLQLFVGSIGVLH